MSVDTRQIGGIRHLDLLRSLYCNLFSLFFFFAVQFLCRDFKIQVLTAAFYLNENVNFKQSATGKMSREGCCC